MRRFKLHIASFVLITAGFLLFLFSCSSSGSDNDTLNDMSGEYIKVTGTVQMFGKSTALTANPSTANEIWSVHYVNGSWDFQNKQQATIDTDGYFSVNVSADSDCNVLLLVDTAQQRKIDQIVGYVAIGVDQEHNMLNFPASQATGDIDLGTVSKDTDTNQADEVKSDEKNVDTVTSNFVFDELKQMASNDRLLRCIKNWYANTDDNSYCGLSFIYNFISFSVNHV